jgi:hypothetical protein
MDNDKLTTEHELFISIGLKVPIKPSVFSKEIDSMIFENIGYVQSWGVHTKHEYIELCSSLQDRLNKVTDALTWIRKNYEEDWTYEEGIGEAVSGIILSLENALDIT